MDLMLEVLDNKYKELSLDLIRGKKEISTEQILEFLKEIIEIGKEIGKEYEHHDYCDCCDFL